MIGPRLAPGWAVGRVVGPGWGWGASIPGRGGVGIGLGHHAAPIPGGIVNNPPVGVMPENPPVFQSRFYRMARGAKRLETVGRECMRPDWFPCNDMINMHGPNNPAQQNARLTQWLFGQLPRPYRLPCGRFVFPITFPFCFAYMHGGRVIHAHG